MLKIYYQEQHKMSGIIIENPTAIYVEETVLVLVKDNYRYNIHIHNISIANELYTILQAMIHTEEEKNYNIYSYLYNRYIHTDFDLTLVTMEIQQQSEVYTYE